ncbi:MAG: hypothetical protein K9J27_03330 [Bacteroidales bacterium]|nr:hypothetical protein [Bacteroidales bacterium]MCF8332807.1 hypothetical protein [Bacteroidales bacterium]
MKTITKEIKIKQGYDSLFFGVSIDHAVNLLGHPNHIEEIEGLQDDTSMAYMYDNAHLVAFFEGSDNKVLTILETRDPEALLFGQEVFKLNEVQIHQLMKDKGFQELETEMLIWEGKRMTFEDANIDFYFENEKLISVNWGSMYGEENFFLINNS